ncbi:MAG: protoporphyrinogen oxidase [Blastocatellia bacterium]|nr:protoporphyrinogen oxidase [Blastocatellia bacterium]
MDMQDVIVVGGGLSGLVCAYYLKRMGRNVLLVEQGRRVGGVMKSTSQGGFLFESGPNSFQNTTDLQELFDYLELTPLLVTADHKAPRYVYYKGKLQAVPMNPGAFISSGLLSLWGKLRLFGEMFVAPLPPGQEQSIEQFITRRFGKEIHDVLVGPFVSGVYAGNSAELSAMAASPFSKLADMEAEHGSILRGQIFGRKKKPTERETKAKSLPRLCSFLGGLETLPRTLQKALVNELLLDCRIHSIEFHNHAPQSHYTLEVEFAGDVQPIHGAALVVATPAYTAARLLGPLSERMAGLLEKIPYPPLASVALAYEEKQIGAHLPKPLEGFGFLVPRTEGVRTLGSVWNSALFPERAPRGWVTLTSFIGGSTDPDILKLSNDEIVQTVHSDLQKIMGISGSPKVLNVNRWERVIPQYTLGFPERRSEIEALTNRYPGLFLAGNYLHGISIGDCVTWSRTVAEQAEDYLLKTMPPSTGITPSTRTGSDLLL